ncbi:ABC transporter ATP-binding protein [Puniceicoccaceae bacterium K14]|nr:ABC transporter ATP-binding protein [Puniceicoccaceae bacterium K14]
MLSGNPTTQTSITDTSSVTAINIEGVSKNFKKFTALNNISFEVKRGECVGIVGLNGAGKSTLLQIIAGTLPASEGKVTCNGKVVALLELGTGFNEEYTGIENLYMNAALLGVPKKLINEKLPEIESFAEIGDFINKPVKTYSSGMKVRLAFSLLTQIDPEIMIIDEALSVGDTYFAHKCAHLMRSFRKQGKTFLFVSHSDAMVKSLCDRAVLLDKGVLIRDGLPNDVLEYYSAMISQKEREFEIQQIEKEKGRTVTRSGNGKASIVRFELMDSDSIPRRKFGIGEKVTISCVLEINEVLDDPTVGFLIRDRVGNDIFGTNTYHHKIDIEKMSAGQQIETTFETELFLGPGEYSLTLAAHDGPDHIENNYDWFDRLIVFNVLPDGRPFFSGTSALPSQVTVSKEISQLNRLYSLGDTIDFTDTGNSHRYTLQGWHKPEQNHTWIDGKKASLAIDIEDSGGSVLFMKAHIKPFVTKEQDFQDLEIKGNGITIFKGKLERAEIIEVMIPAKVFKKSPNIHLEFEIPHALSAAECTKNLDRRVLGTALQRLVIESE